MLHFLPKNERDMSVSIIKDVARLSVSALGYSIMLDIVSVKLNSD